MQRKLTRARKRLSDLKKRPLRSDPGSEEELKALARSWLANPIHDILVRASDLAVGDGNRRVLGLELLGETEAEVALLEGEVSDRDLDRLAMVTAFHRAPLGGYDQACIVRSMTESQPGVTYKELADEMDIDPSMPTRLLSLFDCLPEVQHAAKAGKIGFTVWYAIYRSADQMAALHAALNGSSRADLERQRKPRSAPAVRVARIKCPLPGGPVITVAGDGLGLEEAIEALAEAAKLMRAALAKNLNAKTAMQVWTDVAAHG